MRRCAGPPPRRPAHSPAAASHPSARRKRQGLLGNITSSLDFAQVRSKRDAELLYDAKYGQRGEDGKMTREQYQALRRKVGGTSKDYFKVGDRGWAGGRWGASGSAEGAAAAASSSWGR